MLLSRLAGGIQAAGAQRRVLTDQLPLQFLTTDGAAMFEYAAIEIGPGARQWFDGTVFGAAVSALAVDHHRRRQHQPLHAGGEHLRQQNRGPVVVVTPVGRRVGGIDSGPTTAAWWHTTSTPDSKGAKASASRTSTRDVSSGSSAPGPCAASSMMSAATTSWPSAFSAARTRLPMNPAAPVSRTLMAGRTATRRLRARGSARTRDQTPLGRWLPAPTA